MDDYVVRLYERPELDAYDLLVVRRAGAGVVEYLAPVGWQPGAEPGPMHVRWDWQRTEPHVRLEAGQGIIAQLPTDALPALAEAASRAASLLFPPPASEAEVRVLREVLAAEQARVDQLLARALVVRPASRQP